MPAGDRPPQEEFLENLGAAAQALQVSYKLLALSYLLELPARRVSVGTWLSCLCNARLLLQVASMPMPLGTADMKSATPLMLHVSASLILPECK